MGKDRYAVRGISAGAAQVRVLHVGLCLVVDQADESTAGNRARGSDCPTCCVVADLRVGLSVDVDGARLPYVGINDISLCGAAVRRYGKRRSQCCTAHSNASCADQEPAVMLRIHSQGTDIDCRRLEIGLGRSSKDCNYGCSGNTDKTAASAHRKRGNALGRLGVDHRRSFRTNLGCAVHIGFCGALEDFCIDAYAYTGASNAYASNDIEAVGMITGFDAERLGIAGGPGAGVDLALGHICLGAAGNHADVRCTGRSCVEPAA